MKKFENRHVINIYMILTYFALSPEIGLAGREFTDSYHYGEDCSQLDYLPPKIIIKIVSQDKKENWDNFCHIDPLDRCEEFEASIESFGLLIRHSQRPDICRFVPYLETPEQTPIDIDSQGESNLVPDFFIY